MNWVSFHLVNRRVAQKVVQTGRFLWADTGQGGEVIGRRKEDCFCQGHLCLKGVGVFRAQMTLNQTGLGSHSWEELKTAITFRLVVEWEVRQVTPPCVFFLAIGKREENLVKGCSSLTFLLRTGSPNPTALMIGLWTKSLVPLG